MGRKKLYCYRTTDCLSLVILKTKAWKELTVYCCDHPNLDCSILPAATLRSLWRTSKLLFANIFLVITILMIKWQKIDYFSWLVMNSLVKFVFVSLYPLSTVPFILLKTFKEMIVGTVLRLPILTCMSPAPNDWDSDHNHQALQVLIEDVLVEVLLNIVPIQKSFPLEKSPTNTLWLISWND